MIICTGEWKRNPRKSHPKGREIVEKSNLLRRKHTLWMSAPRNLGARFAYADETSSIRQNRVQTKSRQQITADPPVPIKLPSSSKKESAGRLRRTFSKRLALFTGASGTKPRRLDAQTACEAYARSGGRAGRPCARTKIVNAPGSTGAPGTVLDPSLAKVSRACAPSFIGSRRCTGASSSAGPSALRGRQGPCSAQKCSFAQA